MQGNQSLHPSGHIMFCWFQKHHTMCANANTIAMWFLCWRACTKKFPWSHCIPEGNFCHCVSAVWTTKTVWAANVRTAWANLRKILQTIFPMKFYIVPKGILSGKRTMAIWHQQFTLHTGRFIWSPQAKSPKWWVRVSVTTDGFCWEGYARWNPVSPLETKTYFYVYCYVVSQESYCSNGYSVRQHRPWETHSERIHVWNPERYYQWMQWCQRNIDLERWTLKSI